MKPARACGRNRCEVEGGGRESRFRRTNPRQHVPSVRAIASQAATRSPELLQAPARELPPRLRRHDDDNGRLDCSLLSVSLSFAEEQGGVRGGRGKGTGTDRGMVRVGWLPEGRSDGPSSAVGVRTVVTTVSTHYRIPRIRATHASEKMGAALWAGKRATRVVDGDWDALRTGWWVRAGHRAQRMAGGMRPEVWYEEEEGEEQVCVIERAIHLRLAWKKDGTRFSLFRSLSRARALRGSARSARRHACRLAGWLAHIACGFPQQSQSSPQQHEVAQHGSSQQQQQQQQSSPLASSS